MQIPWHISDTVLDTVLVCLIGKIAGGGIFVRKGLPLSLPLPPEEVEVEAEAGEKGKLVPLPRKVREESKGEERADKGRRQAHYGYKRIVHEVTAFNVWGGVRRRGEGGAGEGCLLCGARISRKLFVVAGSDASCFTVSPPTDANPTYIK